MKKPYETPTITTREVLSDVTANGVSPLVVSVDPIK